MTGDARALARDLIARAGNGGTLSGASDPVSIVPSRVTPSRMPPGAPSTVSTGRRRLEDLPQVRESLARDAQLRDGLGPFGFENPYYRSHNGFNGATISLDGRELINFSSYNYLGLAGHPRMIAAAKAAIDEYGTTSGATRLVSGNIPLHEELEATIASCYGVDDATTVGSGFLTNMSVISFVLGEKDLALCDALVHNSIVAGTMWSQCQRMQFRHNDPESLDGMLRRTRGHFEQVMVILEGVYSMDGDVGRIPELVEVARRHDALVMVDEAHSFAILGENGMGVRDHYGMAPDSVDIWMGTLSKAISSHGGYVAGSHPFIQACRMSAPGMSLFAAGPTPATAAAALTAIQLVTEEPERRRRLLANSRRFLELANRAGLDTGPAEGIPIIPVILGSTRSTVAASAMLTQAGINANPILYPAVNEGEARIRFFFSADHTEEQLVYTVDTLATIVEGLGAFG